ncbi:unnamed protein product [Protopolystoma xenopodis]|uniref:Uncharacterized protein n=1 Tax=Protopolystoma xenopodis TaxID=117903 RepID=A0A448XIX7_9PLAT|nr:unnamed protein product [Protopolystoma xenopodis]
MNFDAARDLLLASFWPILHSDLARPIAILPLVQALRILSKSPASLNRVALADCPRLTQTKPRIARLKLLDDSCCSRVALPFPWQAIDRPFSKPVSYCRFYSNSSRSIE